MAYAGAVSSAAIIADGLFLVVFGSVALTRPDECVQRAPDGVCIQTHGYNSGYREEAGLAIGAGGLFTALGVVVAFMADHYFQVLHRLQSGASVALSPWFSSDGRGGAAGVVLRW